MHLCGWRNNVALHMPSIEDLANLHLVPVDQDGNADGELTNGLLHPRELHVALLRLVVQRHQTEVFGQRLRVGPAVLVE